MGYRYSGRSIAEVAYFGLSSTKMALGEEWAGLAWIFMTRPLLRPDLDHEQAKADFAVKSRPLYLGNTNDSFNASTHMRISSTCARALEAGRGFSSCLIL